jgi:hypothetical protein
MFTWDEIPQKRYENLVESMITGKDVEMQWSCTDGYAGISILNDKYSHSSWIYVDGNMGGSFECPMNDIIRNAWIAYVKELTTK